MSNSENPFDASASGLGYLYQFRYALLLALRRDDDPSLVLSIEKLDDVAFADHRSGSHTAHELLQFKHHIKAKGGLSDKSEDIWKTIRIWTELVRNRAIDLDHCILTMVTTSVVSNRHAVRFLTPDRRGRDSEKARIVLEHAGKESTNANVKAAYDELMHLNVRQRRTLFRSVTLLDTSANILEVAILLQRELRLAVRPQHRHALLERLEGWWLGAIIDHLMSTAANSTLSVRQVHQRVYDLCEQFRRETLPDDLLTAKVPEHELRDDDTRIFVRQLHMIRLILRRIKTAQEDHYRAFAQRSRWIRDNLLELTEIDNFEARLLDEWKHRFEIMMQDLQDAGDDTCCVGGGMALYDWLQQFAPSNSALFIRPQFGAQYMVRGSFHMLADNLRVGWHPHFDHRMNGNVSNE